MIGSDLAIDPRGEQFRERVATPYIQLRTVLSDTYQSAHAISGELRLGLLFPSSGGPALAQIVKLFESRHPACGVVISEVGFDNPLGPLREGEIDIMAMRLPIDQPDLTVGPVLVRDERLVAVAISNPLAQRGSVSIEELADYQAHDAGGKFPQAYVDTLIPPRTPSGRRIARQHITKPTPTHVISLVARDEIVHPTITSFPDHYGHPGVTFVPIDDLPPMEAGLVWRAVDETAAIRAFSRAAADTVADRIPVITSDRG